MSSVSDAVPLRRRVWFVFPPRSLFFIILGGCSDNAGKGEYLGAPSEQQKYFSSAALLLPMAPAQACLAACVISAMTLPDFMALAQ